MNTNASTPDRDFDAFWLLFQVRHAIFEARQKELAKYGVSAIEAFALYAVEQIGHRATPAEIARWMGREPHTVSDLVSRMERRGLVMKVKDLDRRNLVRVELTEKGQKAYRQSLKRQAVHRIFSVLSDEERDQLTPILKKLRTKAHRELRREFAPPNA